MNKNIRDIMKICSVDEKRAFEIYSQMDIDFSECTQKEFINAVREAHHALQTKAT